MRTIIKACVLVWLTVVAPATVEAKESQPALAPPGRCAEPRTAAGPDGAGDDFAVTGPVSSLFDPLDALCSRERCQVRANGDVLYSDSHHLSVAGALRLVPAFLALQSRALAHE